MFVKITKKVFNIGHWNFSYILFEPFLVCWNPILWKFRPVQANSKLQENCTKCAQNLRQLWRAAIQKWIDIFWNGFLPLKVKFNGCWPGRNKNHHLKISILVSGFTHRGFAHIYSTTHGPVGIGHFLRLRQTDQGAHLNQ